MGKEVYEIEVGVYTVSGVTGVSQLATDSVAHSVENVFKRYVSGTYVDR